MSEGTCAVYLPDKYIYLSKCQLLLMAEQYDQETRQMKKSVKWEGLKEKEHPFSPTKQRHRLVLEADSSELQG